MPGRARLSLVWFLAAFGCQGSDLSDVRVSCSTERDCPVDQPRCVGAATPDRPAVVACSSRCQDDSNCLEEEFCERSQGICAYCAPDCTPDTCAEGFVCQPDGRCALEPCSTTGAEPCPPGWRCDPSAPSTDAQGAKPDSNDATRVLRGCARNPCEQSDGIECNDLWRCDPDHSTYETGCLPLPCSDTGRCSDESAFICTPGNAGPRAAGMDAHGCVHRNCGEAANLCSALELCENGACRPRTCAELACPSGTHCVGGDAAITCQVDPQPPASGGTAGGGTGGSGATTSGGTGSSGGMSHGGTTGLGLGHCE